MPRQLKTFVITKANGIFPDRVRDGLRDLADLPRHNVQGVTLVVATTKAEAARYLDVVDPHPYSTYAGSEFGVSTSISERALGEAGVLSEPGTVIAYHHAVKDTAVVRFTADDAQVIGHWRLVDHTITFEPGA